MPYNLSIGSTRFPSFLDIFINLISCSSSSSSRFSFFFLFIAKHGKLVNFYFHCVVQTNRIKNYYSRQFEMRKNLRMLLRLLLLLLLIHSLYLQHKDIEHAASLHTNTHYEPIDYSINQIAQIVL